MSVYKKTAFPQSSGPLNHGNWKIKFVLSFCKCQLACKNCFLNPFGVSYKIHSFLANRSGKTPVLATIKAGWMVWKK